MAIIDKLGITIITYNRAPLLKRTLTTILSDDSPVRDCYIIVQSNNSSDETSEVVKTLQSMHPNLSYRENPYNIGLSGNICKAMELADKEYHWILCDDDRFDWQNWFIVLGALCALLVVVVLSYLFGRSGIMGKV